MKVITTIVLIVCLKGTIFDVLLVKPGPNYSVSGSGARKTGGDGCNAVVVSSAVFAGVDAVEWGVRIVNTQYSSIMVGVAPSDIDQSVVNQYNKSGWYLHLHNGCYHSGPPQNYRSVQTSPFSRVEAGETVRVRLDRTRKTLTFSVGGAALAPLYEDIPAGPLSPVVILCNANDEIEFVC